MGSSLSAELGCTSGAQGAAIRSAMHMKHSTDKWFPVIWSRVERVAGVEPELLGAFWPRGTAVW